MCYFDVYLCKDQTPTRGYGMKADERLMISLRKLVEDRSDTECESCPMIQAVKKMLYDYDTDNCIDNMNTELEEKAQECVFNGARIVPKKE